MAVRSLRSERLTMPATVDFLRTAWARFEPFLRGAGWSDREVLDWYVAFCELLNNAIRHGSGMNPGKTIGLEWWREDAKTFLAVEDEGQGPPERLLMTPSLPEDLTQISGRGLYLLHEFCDGWEHWRSPRGYRCVLWKQANSDASANQPSDDWDGVVGSFVTSVDRFSAFYRLGAALLTHDEPLDFINRGLEWLPASLTRPPDGLRVILTERAPAAIRTAFPDDHQTALGDEGMEAVKRVVVGGRTLQWDASTPSAWPGHASGCCHPISSSEENFGCLLAASQAEEFPLSDVMQCRTFADLFGIAIGNFHNRQRQDLRQRQLRESEIAMDIQRNLLAPTAPPLSGRWQVTQRHAASNNVAGDYLEAALDERGDLILVVIDVMGKSASAAIFALMFRVALHMRLGGSLDCAAFLQHCNQLLCQWLDELTTFTTCAMVKVPRDLTSLEVVNAGHCPVLLFHRGKLRHEVGGSGPPLGVSPRQSYQTFTASLDEVDSALLVSDGLFEWREGGTSWGWSAFRQFAAERMARGPIKLWNELERRIAASGHPSESLDDRTMLHWTMT